MMGFAGRYKLVKLLQMTENGKTYESVEDVLAKETDPDEIERIQKDIDTILYVTEDAVFKHLYPIPEGVSQAEIDEAINDGAEVVDNYLAFAGEQGKFEDGNIYVHDPSMFLTGEEWVKVNDEDGNINMISMVYAKID